VARLLERIEGSARESQTRREQGEGMEHRAKRIITEGLSELGWDEQRLKDERKGHPIKVELAQRVRRETTMTLKWIAAALNMGTWTHVSNLLQRPRI